MSEATPGELPAGTSLCSLAYPLALFIETGASVGACIFRSAQRQCGGPAADWVGDALLAPRKPARLTASRDRRGLRGEVWQDAGYPKGDGAPGADSAALCSHWLTLAGTYPRSGPLLGAREPQAAGHARGSCLGIFKLHNMLIHMMAGMVAGAGAPGCLGSVAGCAGYAKVAM